MIQATNAKKQILASQIAYKRTQNNEVQLERALAKFFNKLKKEVLNALDEYWKDYQMLQGHIDLITAPVHEAHKEYYELLTLYIKREYQLGSAEAKRLVKLANSKQRVASKSMRMPVRAIIKKDNDLFGTLPSAEERLLNRTFTASERTLSRVDSQINQIITDGYRSGKGINDVANSLTQRFDQLTSWESKRIARTEIHNSHNTAVMDTYNELGVEYTMWVAAEDERTRDSHLEINGEIIPIGSEYSNGLKYPGDTDGDIEEWINCRCSNAPFVIPYGYIAPSFSPFRESDLIKVETKPLVNEPQQVNEPTEEQIQQNLTPKEQRQLEGFQKQIKEFERYLETTQNPTETQLKNWNESLEDRKKMVQELKNKALGIEAPKAPLQEIKAPTNAPVSSLENYTLETMKKDIPLSDEDFNKFLKWSEKRATKNKIEYGYQFDTKTGKLVGKEIKGKKGGVTFKEQGENLGSMHTHPPEQKSVGGGAFPSPKDLKAYRGQDGADHLIGSPKEVWYVHAEEKLGIRSADFGQREIDKVYSKVYDEVSEKGKQLVKEGKLKTDDASLRKFLDKEIGDGLLREFNTPEWQEKGFYLRRAYR